MRADLEIRLSTILGFILVLSRMLGIFVFLPLPGKDAGPSTARVVLAFSTALALLPQWPMPPASDVGLGLLCFWLVSEAALGLTIGLLISFLAESLIVGAHILGLQAGYAYASVIDPTTQADSDVLQVVAQLTGGLLFFSFGLDHFAIRAFARSITSYPPGHFLLTPQIVSSVAALSGSIFSVGLQLALPVVGLLLMTEIAFALVGRLSSQLHLGFNAGAIKMLLTLLILGSVLRVLPHLYEKYAGQVTHLLEILFPAAREVKGVLLGR